MIVVVSTSYDTPIDAKTRCLESVRSQTLGAHCHVYIEADKQEPPKNAAENLHDVVMSLPPHAIVVWLDGDDWLADNEVLAKVAAMYDDTNVWLTYGSYRVADGRPSAIRGKYETDNFRGTEWRASHLKTFYAGLYQAIPEAYHRNRRGVWHSLAVDQAVMFPMLEMAGLSHIRHCPDVLAVYNFANSFEHNTDVVGIRAEAEASSYLRGLPRMLPLQVKSWDVGWPL